MRRKISTAALSLLVVALLCPSAYGQENGSNESNSDEWEFRFVPYFWIISLSGDATVKGRSVSVDASFGDILSNSDSIFAFAGFFEARKRKWAVYLDGTYVKMGTDDSMVGPLVANTDSEVALFGFGAMYRFAQGHWGDSGDGFTEQPRRRWSVDAVAGGRYTSIDNTIAVQNVPLPQVNDNQNWADPIIGARILTDLSRSRKWDARIYGDIGGFGVGSDFTWQAFGLVGYNFPLFKTDGAVLLGYRALFQDYETGGGVNKFAWDMTIHGPYLGLSIGW